MLLRRRKMRDKGMKVMGRGSWRTSEEGKGPGGLVGGLQVWGRPPSHHTLGLRFPLAHLTVLVSDSSSAGWE